MGVQDDRREDEQIELFELDLPDDKSRSGTDAVLNIGSVRIEFELKSTTKETVTTVRDFGLEHIEKWTGKHWLFGFYTSQGKALRYTRYASPQMMAPWIEDRRNYIEADFQLAELAPARLVLDDLYQLIGKQAVYSLQQAQKLQKKQLTDGQYRQLQDCDEGFSAQRMLELLKLRCQYVIRRGSTLNNPHIPKAVLEGFPQITADHASELRRLVGHSLKS
jgi:hypothetical protein